MPIQIFHELAPQPFDFRASVCSHGWRALKPFEWNEREKTLCRTHQLAGGQVVHIALSGAENSVQVRVETPRFLSGRQLAEIRGAVRRMLRLDEDLSRFYQRQRQFDNWSLNVQPGGGRLLRCPRLFEDIVCTLCTTNISWSGTKRMVANLVDTLGAPFVNSEGRLHDEWRAFPTPEAIVDAGEEILKSKAGLGYRSTYVNSLAETVVNGELDLQRLQDPEQPVDDVRRGLLRIKGIGEYATATILMILGRYEYLAIDSEMRSFVSKKYFAGQPVTDGQIQSIYEAWGEWRYLAYWFDPADG